MNSAHKWGVKARGTKAQAKEGPMNGYRSYKLVSLQMNQAHISVSFHIVNVLF